MSAEKVYRAIGTMSGTSLDGIDVALIETDGREMIRPLVFSSYPYAQRERDAIYAALGSSTPTEDVKTAEDVVTRTHVMALKLFMKEFNLTPDQVDVIGFHGQTIFHDPENHFTWQIGDSAEIAQRIGINVVGDFRKSDMAHGGHGAPLLPLYHKVMLAGREHPIAVLNIGGVSNVTYIGASEDDLRAFDCGPGNALLDDFIRLRTGEPYDEGGALSASGIVDEDLLREWMSHEFFSKKGPKSLDRDEWDVKKVYQLGDADGAATLAAFTVAGIVHAAELLPQKPKVWLVCGGGRHNHHLMDRLGDALDTLVHNIDELGINGDAVEAQGFAYYAARHLLQLPVTFPGTTGVDAPCGAGVLYRAGGII